MITAYATVSLANNTPVTWDSTRFTVDGNSYTDGAGESSLPLGSAVGRTIQIEVSNHDDAYTSTDFYGARIALSYKVDAASPVLMGTFTVITPATYGETITISAVDDMYKADKSCTLAYTSATTIAQIFRDACSACGISYNTSTFTNSTYSVSPVPDLTRYTYRQIFGFIAAIAGGNAHINPNGYMTIKTYSFPEVAPTVRRTTTNSHAQSLPNNLSSTTNLYTALTPVAETYTGTAWGLPSLNPSYGYDIVSVTIPVFPGDLITANSFKKNTENGDPRGSSGNNGIRVTYFRGDTVVNSYTPAQIYTNFNTNAAAKIAQYGYSYIPVPDNVDCVNISWWTRDPSNYAYILNAVNSSSDMDVTADLNLSDWISLRTDTTDITITGIQTTVSTEDGETTVLHGNAGYVLDIDNPLIEGNAAAALALIAPYVVGHSFRKFEGEYTEYPSAKFMDTVKITDRKGNVYGSVITDMTFNFCGTTSFSNSAESKLMQGSSYVSSGTKAIQKAESLNADTRSMIQRLVDNSTGFYTTDVPDGNGGVIRYYHDRPDLADSSSVIRVAAGVIGFSTDGGSTYPFGVAVDGNTILGIIAAEGLNADWIETGTLRIGRSATASYGKVEMYSGGSTPAGEWDGDSFRIYGEDDNGIPTRMQVDDAAVKFGRKTSATPEFSFAAVYGGANAPTSLDHDLMFIKWHNANTDFQILDNNDIARFWMSATGDAKIRNAAGYNTFEMNNGGTTAIRYGGFTGANATNTAVEVGASAITHRRAGTAYTALDSGNVGNYAITSSNIAAAVQNNLPFVVARGYVTLTNYQWHTVYFSNGTMSGTFTSAPAVVVSYGNDAESAGITPLKTKDETATGFKVCMAGSGTDIARRVYWIAIGS